MVDEGRNGMRTAIMTLWVLFPVGFGAYHLGPGQARMRLDEAGDLLAEAEDLAARGQGLLATDAVGARADFTLAKERLAEALALVPEAEEELRLRVRLELAKCQMNASELPQASASLAGLVEELTADPEADAALLAEARAAYASSQYYMTWL